MIEVVDVWISAFIPGNVFGSFAVENGVHAGKRAIRGPALDQFFDRQPWFRFIDRCGCKDALSRNCNICGRIL